MPVDAPPRADAAPALLAPPDAAAAHARSKRAAPQPQAPHHLAWLRSSWRCSRWHWRARARTAPRVPDSASESHEARASKRPRFRCRNCGQEGSAYRKCRGCARGRDLLREKCPYDANAEEPPEDYFDQRFRCPVCIIAANAYT